MTEINQNRHKQVNSKTQTLMFCKFCNMKISKIEKHSVLDREFPRIFPIFPEFTQKSVPILEQSFQCFSYRNNAQKRQNSSLIQQENKNIKNNNKNNKAITKTSRSKIVSVIKVENAPNNPKMAKEMDLHISLIYGVQ